MDCESGFIFPLTLHFSWLPREWKKRREWCQGIDFPDFSLWHCCQLAKAVWFVQAALSMFQELLPFLSPEAEGRLTMPSMSITRVPLYLCFPYTIPVTF